MTRLIPNPKTAAIASACALALSVGLVLTPPAALAQDNQYHADWRTRDGTNAMVVLPDERLALSGGGTLEFWAYPTWDASTADDPVAVAYVSEDGPAYAISLLAEKDGLAILREAAEEGDRRIMLEYYLEVTSKISKPTEEEVMDIFHWTSRICEEYPDKWPDDEDDKNRATLLELYELSLC